VEHYLLECRTYREQREKLRREAGEGVMHMERLLGDPKIVKHWNTSRKQVNLRNEMTKEV
jgi:hypothetical protein